MKLCLLLLLAAASSALGSPVPWTKMGRNIDQEDQGRLLPLAIFNNGVTASTAATPTTATTASTTTTATTAGTASTSTTTTTTKSPVRANGGAVEPTAELDAPTRNVLQGLQPTSVNDLPPASELAQILNQQQAGPAAAPTVPSTLAGLANMLNPFRFLGLNNLANLPQTAAINQAIAGGGPNTGVYIWTPTGGSVPYTLGNRPRVLDEPEQIDPNFLRQLQQLYYSSRQNLQQSSYLPPQFYNSIGYPTPVGYTNPIPNVNTIGQPQLSAYQPVEAPSYNSESTAAKNPYHPMYLISIPTNFDANGITQNQISGAGLETILKKNITKDESKPVTIDQDTAVKIEIKKDDAKPEIGVQETSGKVDKEKKDTAKSKPDSEMEKTSGSKTEKVPNQDCGKEQGKPHNTDINQPAGGVVKDTDSQDSKTDNQSEPSNLRGNSKFFVKFSRDPTTQQQRVVQEHQSRSAVPPQEDSHGPLVSSYRLQHTSAT